MTCGFLVDRGSDSKVLLPYLYRGHGYILAYFFGLHSVQQAKPQQITTSGLYPASQMAHF
jgi:hypothetical protein